MFELRPFERRNDLVFDPFREMERMERAFFNDDFFGKPAWGRRNGRMLPMAFGTDVQDKGDHYLLEADLPGFKKEDISVQIDGDVMTIKAQRNDQQEEKDQDGNYLFRERSYGSYERSFDLTGVKQDAIEAKYNDGVLELKLPKMEETVPESRRLEIH